MWPQDPLEEPTVRHTSLQTCSQENAQGSATSEGNKVSAGWSMLVYSHCPSSSGLQHAPETAPKMRRLHIQPKHEVVFHFVWLSWKPFGLSWAVLCPMCAHTSKKCSEIWPYLVQVVFMEKHRQLLTVQTMSPSPPWIWVCFFSGGRSIYLCHQLISLNWNYFKKEKAWLGVREYNQKASAQQLLYAY